MLRLKSLDELRGSANRVVPATTPLQRLQALGRLKTGQMNATEARYAAHLGAEMHAGRVAWYKFEGIKFRLADGSFYSPDFAVMLTGGAMEIHEVKSVWLEDAKTKVKVAADLYPFRFIAVKAAPKKFGGGWTVEEF